MVRGSARAATLLAQFGGPAPEDTVASEIGALYAELVPRRADRRLALELYAIWLERTAGGIVSDRSSHSSPKGCPLGNIGRASLVARLAHTQAVRLRGPDYPGGLNQEAALVRSLLRQEIASSTLSPTETGT